MPRPKKIINHFDESVNHFDALPLADKRVLVATLTRLLRYIEEADIPQKQNGQLVLPTT
jgi:hypothetical protein